MKYHGAFAGFGLMPTLALGPIDAPIDAPSATTAASTTSAWASSRTNKSGKNIVRASGAPAAWERTPPPARRTRQKW